MIMDGRLRNASTWGARQVVCSYCHSTIDSGASFCDVCGQATLRSLELRRNSLQAEINRLERSAERSRVSHSEVDSMEEKAKTLTDTLQRLTNEVERLTDQKRELTVQLETLTATIQSLEPKKMALEAQVNRLEQSTEQITLSKSQIESLDSRTRSLTDTLKHLTDEVERLDARKRELTSQTDALTATIPSLEGKKLALQEEINDLEKSVEEARTSRTEVQSLNDRIKTLTATLQPLTDEVQTLSNKKLELTTETEILTNRTFELKTLKQTEEAAVDYLRKERVQLQKQVKHPPRKKITISHDARRPARTKRRPRTKQTEHVFVGQFTGTADWNTELARLITQFYLSLDHSTYAVLADKIVFKVIGSRENIEKLAESLNKVPGFVNLRSKLVATRRGLNESIEARNIQRRQLDSLNAIPWYRRNPRAIGEQKTQLTKQIVSYDVQIKKMSEDLRTIESLLGSEQGAAQNQPNMTVT
jgi:predicted  nucleic acid-binding Zn-ribbon protein